MKTVINSYDEFVSYLGKPLGTSEWLEVDQDRINALPTRLLTTNGFTWMLNVLRLRVRTRALSHTVT